MQKIEIPEDVRGVMDGSSAFIGPAEVTIDLTNRCNNNCIACWTRSPLLRDKAAPEHWRSLEFPYSLMKEIVQDLLRLGTKSISFSGGGDPLMHPHLVDLVEYVKSLGMICSVTTNFTLADKSKVDRMIDAGLDDLVVSLWAGDPATYARVHPNKTERTFQRIEHLLHEIGTNANSPTWITIANVLFNMNYANAVQMFDFAKQVRANAVYFTLADPIPDRTDCLLLSPEQTKELLGMMGEIEKMAANLSNDERIELPNFVQFRRRLANPDSQGGHYDSNIINSLPCYIGWLFCRLLPDGTVSPCCRGVNKPMGNLFRSSFEEIWHSPAYCEFRNKAKHLKKTNPYFRPIGCDTTCDNLHQIFLMHKRVLELYPHLESELIQLQE